MYTLANKYCIKKKYFKRIYNIAKNNIMSKFYNFETDK